MTIILAETLLDKVHTYQRAYRFTAKILYGKLWDKATRCALSPDLKALRPRLLKLSLLCGFNCVELACLFASRIDPDSLICGKQGTHKKTDPRILMATKALKGASTKYPMAFLGASLQELHERAEVGEIE